MRKPAAILGLGRRGPDQANHHEGRRLKTGCLVAVGENNGGARRQSADILEIAEFADLERHQPKLLLDRNLLADRRRRKHLPDGLVGIDFGGILGHLDGDIAGKSAAGQDHRVTPHIVRAILGVFGGVVGKPGRGLDALRLYAPGARRIGLEGGRDFAIGVGREFCHQYLDALVLGFEADESLGAGEAH